MIRRSLALVALFACQPNPDWTKRELKPTTVELGNGVKVSMSVPDGLKRSNAVGEASARYESAAGDGPLVSISIDDGLRQEMFTTAPAGASGFEKRELANGEGFVYQKDGPHVHVRKKIGASAITCDAFFLGQSKDDLKRAETLWKICSSMT
jgi:hypothetical protein